MDVRNLIDTYLFFYRLLLATAIAEQHTFLTRDGPILDLGLPFVERG